MSEKMSNAHQGNWRHVSGSVRVLAGLALLAASGPIVLADDNRAPEVPQEIKVPDDVKVHFHGYAEGFQVYTWDGTKWGPAVPDATLFDDEGNVVAKHFAGPTWQSNSGSLVVGALPPARVTVDDSAIQWLRLSAATNSGVGIFAETTFIHRVNTVGGLQPFENGTVVGEVAKVPYTADYFFYRHSDN